MLRSICALVISVIFTTDFFFFHGLNICYCLSCCFPTTSLSSVALGSTLVALLSKVKCNRSWNVWFSKDGSLASALSQKKKKKKKCHPNFQKPEIKASSLYKSIAINFTHEFTGGGMITANVSILRRHNLSRRVALMELETPTSQCKHHGPCLSAQLKCRKRASSCHSRCLQSFTVQ